ncbi:histidine kinase N-terminal 7TM domain-containing diguanylate cyclase [Gracilibacillus ureilyticus]|nr:diguanylate cyclase [Gracilibacillus ureilyticus]
MEPYTYYLSIFGLLLFFVGIILLKKPRTLSRILLSTSLLLISLFIIFTALELLFEHYQLMLWLRNLQQVSLYLCPVILFGYARELYKQNHKITMKYVYILAIPSVLSVLLIFTNQWHGWMRESVGIQEIWNLTEIAVMPTRLGMVLSVYPTFLTFFTVVLLLRNMGDLPVNYRWSHIFSAVAICIPLVFTMLFSFIPYNVPGKMALSFTFMAILLVIVNKRYDLNSIWPVSRHKILESLDEGILLFDYSNRLIEINHSGSRILQQTFQWDASSDQLLGRHVSEIFQQDQEVIMPVVNREDIRFEWKSHTSYFQLNIVPLGNEQNGMLLVVITDLTEMKLIEQKLYQLAHHDELTCISNRRSFIEKFNELVNSNSDFSFLLLDVDYFKQFNDNYGHIVGDQVLQKLALLLDSFFSGQSEQSTVGRIGGEEFAVLIDKGVDDTIRIAKEFQQLLADQPIRVTELEEEVISVSIGIATNSHNDLFTFERAYNEADQALYRAKNGGRDEVEVY